MSAERIWEQDDRLFMATGGRTVSVPLHHRGDPSLGRNPSAFLRLEQVADGRMARPSSPRPFVMAVAIREKVKAIFRASRQT